MIRRYLPAFLFVVCLGAAAYAGSRWALGTFPEQRGLMRTVALVVLATGVAGVLLSRMLRRGN